MLCPQCQEQGERSKVYAGMVSRTLMGGGERYWDEDGVLHAHDPNKSSKSFWCSKEHHWLMSLVTPCPAEGCDYGKEQG